MSNVTEYKVVVTSTGADVFDRIDGDIQRGTEHISHFNQTMQKAGEAMLFLNQGREALAAMGQQLNDAIEPGMRFDAQLKDTQAVTKVTDAQIKLLGDSARDNAKAFGVDQAKAVEGYKIALSKLGPEIATNGKLMDEIGKGTAAFSKQLGGDVSLATQVASTALNAYNIDMGNAEEATKAMWEQMDMMTTAAQIGSAELPAVQEALANIGPSAVLAKVGFAEVNSMIQVLDKNSIVAGEAGTKINRIMGIMGKGRFIPKDTLQELERAGVDINKLADTTIPFAQRLTELQKIQSDSALIAKFFGEENKDAANVLLNNIPLLQSYEAQIKAGGGSTMEYANVILSGATEQQNKLNVQIADFGISMQQAMGNFSPFIGVITKGLTVLGNLGFAVYGVAMLMKTEFVKSMWAGIVASGRWLAAQTASAIGTTIAYGIMAVEAVIALGAYITSLVVATAAQWGLNVAMYANPVGLFVLGLLAIGAAVAAVIIWFDEIVDALIAFAKFAVKLNPFYWLIELTDFIFPGFKQSLIDTFNQVIDFFKKLWDKAVEVWEGLKSMFGFGEGAEATIKVQADGNTVTKVEGNGGAGTLESLVPRAPTTPTTPSPVAPVTPSGGGGGGGSIKNIRVEFKNLVEKFEVHIDGANGIDTSKIKDLVQRALVDALRDTEIIAGS